MMNLLCGFKALDTVTYKPDGCYWTLLHVQQIFLCLDNYIIFSNSCTDMSNSVMKATKDLSLIRDFKVQHTKGPMWTVDWSIL